MAGEFWSRSMKIFLKDNDIEMHPIWHIHWQIYEKLRSLNPWHWSQKSEITDHDAIKVKTKDIYSSIYFKYIFDSNKKKQKFKNGDYVMISKNIFVKDYVKNERYNAIDLQLRKWFWKYDNRNILWVKTIKKQATYI